MNERFDDLPDVNDQQQREIDFLVDTRGIPYSEARFSVLGSEVEPVSRNESQMQHPSNHVVKKPYRRVEARRDGDTFETIDTSGLSDEQIETNRIGVAGLREALRRSREAESTPEERRYNLAQQQAAKDRRHRP